MTDKPIPFIDTMVRALIADTKGQTRRVLKGAWQAALEGHDHVHTWFAPPHIPTLGVPNEWAQSGIWAKKYGPRGYTRFLGATAYRPGDRLYVREAYFQLGHWEPLPGRTTKGGRQKWAFVPDAPEILFDAPEQYRLGRHHKDPATSAWHKRLGRFMPKAASRLTLIVTDVRVQRLQEISEEDAIAEGVCQMAEDSDHPGMWEGLSQKDRTGLTVSTYGSNRKAFQHLWESINGPDAWDANPWVAAYSFTVHRKNISEITS